MADRKEATRHISSAVVSVLEDCRDAAVDRIDAMPGAEVVHAEASKIIVVMETDSNGEAGTLLSRMATLEGVLSANLAFEHAEDAEVLGEVI